MYKTADEIGNLIRNRSQAQEVIAELLQRFTGNAAFERLTGEAHFAKQTTDETAWRTAGNLLNSFVTRKPGGEVF